VNPATDAIVIGRVLYVSSVARLVVDATDLSPGVQLAATLAGPNGESPTINPATGQPYTGAMGPIIPFATGVFTITFTNVPPAPLTTIRSSAGGMVTSPVTVTREHSAPGDSIVGLATASPGICSRVRRLS